MRSWRTKKPSLLLPLKHWQTHADTALLGPHATTESAAEHRNTQTVWVHISSPTKHLCYDLLTPASSRCLFFVRTVAYSFEDQIWADEQKIENVSNWKCKRSSYTVVIIDVMSVSHNGLNQECQIHFSSGSTGNPISSWVSRTDKIVPWQPLNSNFNLPQWCDVYATHQ